MSDGHDPVTMGPQPVDNEGDAMATREEVRALLAVTCGWCGALPGERCYVISDSQKRRRRRITTLDGGCHDSRWRAVFGRDAKVIASAIQPGRTRAPVERPW